MKIKVFKFEVSNCTSSGCKDDHEQSFYKRNIVKIISPKTIEETVNDYCIGKLIKDIKVNEVRVSNHNNGRGNTVELWYTVIYE